MAAVILTDDSSLTPDQFSQFLSAQPDLSPKAWPRYVRIADDLPTTATNKIVKRQLKQQGISAGDDALWVREPRTTEYRSISPAGV